MRIIGHRGAAGLALENSIASIKAAKKAGVDAIEFDVRLTADGYLVLAHDKTTRRISKKKHRILRTKFQELKKALMYNQEEIPSLQNALLTCGQTPAIIEAKDDDWAEPLAAALADAIKPSSISVISFNLQELEKFSKIYPKATLYALNRTSPFDAILTAQAKGFDGIDIPFWMINPLVYYLARKRGLDILVFTINSLFLAIFIKWLYPEVGLTTNFPDRLQKLR